MSEQPSTIPAPSPDAKQSRKSSRKNRHRGVLLLGPDKSHTSWRVRYREAGKVRTVKLTPTDALTAKSREDFCCRLWAQIQVERGAIRQGAPGRLRAADAQIKSVLESYFRVTGDRLAPETTRVYRIAANRLLDYCLQTGVRSTGQLTPGRLRGFALHLQGTRKAEVVQGGKRGQYQIGAQKLQPISVNRDIRSTRTILIELSRLELIRLSVNDIKESLRHRVGKVERRPFLKPDQVRELLRCAQDYDAKHRKGGPEITPVILFFLCSGLRLSEGLGILGSDWSPTELKVRSTIAKTKVSRVLDLKVSTTLLAMAQTQHGDRRTLEGHTKASIKNTFVRLCRRGAPHFSAHTLRRTCETTLACAPGIWGGASLVKSAHQLGHDPAVATRHYVGSIDIPKGATTLEEAWGITP